ncbi:hypothetical protein [Streptomyces sp. NPDC003710]
MSGSSSGSVDLVEVSSSAGVVESGSVYAGSSPSSSSGSGSGRPGLSRPSPAQLPAREGSVEGPEGGDEGEADEPAGERGAAGAPEAGA